MFFMYFFANILARKYTEVACSVSKTTSKFENKLWIAFNLSFHYISFIDLSKNRVDVCVKVRFLRKYCYRMGQEVCGVATLQNDLMVCTEWYTSASGLC